MIRVIHSVRSNAMYIIIDDLGREIIAKNLMVDKRFFQKPSFLLVTGTYLYVKRSILDRSVESWML